MLLLVALHFLTFIFSTGIKLFIQHPVVLFGTLILLEKFDDFLQLPPLCILKDRQLCLLRYLKFLCKLMVDLFKLFMQPYINGYQLLSV